MFCIKVENSFPKKKLSPKSKIKLSLPIKFLYFFKPSAIPTGLFWKNLPV